MKKIYFLSSFMLGGLGAHAQGPEVTSWIVNHTISTGYSGIPSNVQSVYYNTTDVYVSCTCIPGYDIGPWTGDPNIPSNQDFCYKITRNPIENTGTKVTTPLGHIGVWTNGVSIYNAKDAFSYNNYGIWNQDALYNEGSSFDECLGHPAPSGEYHNHVNPTCLYEDTDDSNHSPLIGYAFDGFPIYGANAYSNTTGGGGIRRMLTSYRKRSITDRTTLPDGTVLSSTYYGPAINASNPLGKYIEDYEYVAGLGDLDQYNGRFCVTPEYPSGIYAYFVTIDSTYNPVYPYVLGPQYYGTVQAGNSGPGSAHNTIPGSATMYATAGIDEQENNYTFSLFPNPAATMIQVRLQNVSGPVTIAVYDMNGKGVIAMNNYISQNIDISSLQQGTYNIVITTMDGLRLNNKLVKL